MTRSFYLVFLISAVIAAFALPAEAAVARRGVRMGKLGVSLLSQPFDTAMSSGTTTQTARLFRTGGTSGTCDTPVAAPTQANITGSFQAQYIRYVSDYTGCITVKLYGLDDGRVTATAYSPNYSSADGPKANLIGYAPDWVEARGESVFFSFYVTAGQTVEIRILSTESKVEGSGYMWVRNDSLAEPSDFDGDGVTDSAVFRPSTGAWYILQSSNNTLRVDFFGVNGDVPLDGDFDGDGKSDVGTFRPSDGTWYYRRSSNNVFFGAYFGLGTDAPIPGDYDGDGITDIGAYRNGQWFISPSAGMHATLYAYNFGSPGDIPISSQRK